MLCVADDGRRSSSTATSISAAGVSEDDYVAMRQARDATLKVPKLLYPAIQVNIRGGRLPPNADADGRRFLKLPLTLPAEA